ncbi:DEAD/DEAH box helicase [Noviherbaspirillum galbum]|uniref:DEAD/DEAH box helicase n=1 Tax=Noviherbaspirillum galbum TaxID=2709383 RepID=A0A6B3SPN0_9BURK|nr:DEAD/DEAH box helicase [Noviherbaspirillum galbum]NEX62458.1 DEAD/DEAH box helicase [Noviherbaspirillum galbum]
MTVSYNHDDILYWLGLHTVGKARGYRDAVTHLEWRDARTLAGAVQGTRMSPYAVKVSFHDAWIESECSCPVGTNCKHVAALLAAALDHRLVAPSPGIRRELATWLEGFRNRQSAPPAGEKRQAQLKATQALAYVVTRSYSGETEVVFFKGKLDGSGAIRSLDSEWNNVEQALIKPPKFVSDEDIVILRGLWLGRSRESTSGYRLLGKTGSEILERLLGTGRAFVLPSGQTMFPIQPSPVHAAGARTGRTEWHVEADERMRPALQVDPAASLIVTTTEPFWYFDAASGEAGPVSMTLPARQVADFLSMPPISLDEAAAVASVLCDVAPGLPLPPASNVDAFHIIDADPVPLLVLDSLPLHSAAWTPQSRQMFDFATVIFDYGGQPFAAQSTSNLSRLDSGEIVQIQRKHELELRYFSQLHGAGLRKIAKHSVYGPKPFPEGMLAPRSVEDWPDFMKQTVPALRELGWKIDMSADFRFNVIEIDDIAGEARPTGEGWFELEMGIAVHDRTVRLEPLLAQLFRRDPRWLGGELDAIADDETVELKTDRNERLHLRASRLKPVVRVLIDLFDSFGNADMKISAWDAGRMSMLEQTGHWTFHGNSSAHEIARRLSQGVAPAAVPVPPALKATLRPYQQEGLNWMQFLRQNDLAGVLADDMGLGKTIQTLAHILAEKEAGRLDRPAMVVMPTSLMHNWKDEARRFASTLSVLELQGARRREHFDRIGAADLVLTTYPLLWRDADVLSAQEYHLLVLDEAQYVKNASTKAASVLRRMRARHRLCLTGTPLENHLGELWSQFDFLLPGFLGTQQDFTRRWRTPIEKGGDTARRDLLTRRLRPFMLRRRKDQVAKDLPPKTTIIQTVDLSGAQRDLYETVRTAMQEKVRAAIQAKGLARSHIVVLDALLKLRQVCCDPRLLPVTTAGRVKESAKLQQLMEMLPSLIDEGRRILVFSQFTSMLDLIAASLGDAGIAFEMLTGETADRAAPVKRFMEGKAPVFLISLKAGGVGLNLTAADTVIHYDPWWNPAAETQATDRTHRIGQDKPVFVYKLIAAGSVEEKIVAMQERKAALADAILSESATGAAPFTAGDIDALLEPMPGEEGEAPKTRKKRTG